jgi:hypothetical protein
MISSIDHLDIDVSNLLGKYIETKKKNKRVLNDLKDNITFTTHINYYKIIMRRSEPARNDYHLSTMYRNKFNTLNQIKHNGNKKGWIYSPTFSGFSWIISPVKSRELVRRPKYDKVLYGDPIENVPVITTCRYETGILKFPDESEWTLYRYPPRKNEIPIQSKDLIKHIKIK